VYLKNPEDVRSNDDPTQQQTYNGREPEATRELRNPNDDCHREGKLRQTWEDHSVRAYEIENVQATTQTNRYALVGLPCLNNEDERASPSNTLGITVNAHYTGVTEGHEHSGCGLLATTGVGVEKVLLGNPRMKVNVSRFRERRL